MGTDLDLYECPPALIENWLTDARHHNLLVRVAVREAEAWVLADRHRFADFLGIQVMNVPEDAESLSNPKEALIQLARTSRKKRLRDDICPPPNSTRRVGPNYNARLGSFVSENWDPTEARLNSQSLDRTIARLIAFRPQWAVIPH